jgi:Mlc titration factor MtfA (ptsG expression regulator)
MLFSWLRQRRRRAIAAAPFPAEWEALLVAGVRQVAWLDADEARQLRGLVAVLLAEKRFEGCGGLEVTDEMRLVIAGQMALVTLGLPLDYLDRLRSVLVYPGDFRASRRATLGGGAEIEWQEPLEGEVWTEGSMVLSWPRAAAGGRLRDGPRSVVIHESTHMLDAHDGAIDGLPPLPSAAWATGITACREHFREVLDEGRGVPFDDYADTSPAEFLAVASECFFQDPHRLWRFDRGLYDLLAAAWRQDPRRRVPASGLAR